jgi:hypothetical protein
MHPLESGLVIDLWCKYRAVGVEMTSGDGPIDDPPDAWSKHAWDVVLRWWLSCWRMSWMTTRSSGRESNNPWAHSNRICRSYFVFGCSLAQWGCLGERSSVPGASSLSSLVDTRLCKIYNEYEICKMQYAKGGSCRTSWVWINVLLIGKTPSPDPGLAIRCASRVGLGIFLLSMN